MAREEAHQYTPDEINEYGEYIKIGGSPVPGITLRHVLRGHSGILGRIAYSPGGLYLASPSHDKTIRIWDTKSGNCLKVLDSQAAAFSVAWSPDGEKMAAGLENNKVVIWNTDNWKSFLSLEEHEGGVWGLAWSPDGHKLASGSADQTVRIWSIGTSKTPTILNVNKGTIWDLAWSQDGQKLAIASQRTLQIWNAESQPNISNLQDNARYVASVAWIPQHNLLLSCGEEKIIKGWDVQAQTPVRDLEGHTDSIFSLAVSANDGLLLASKGINDDSSIRLWRTDTWEMITVLREKSTGGGLPCIAFNPRIAQLATLGGGDTMVRIWDIESSTLLRNSPISKSIHYTTAKLVLVGDSGVGKTGLGWRLAHNEFKEHSSTHGQQFWVVPELKKTRADGTECEAVLWDLAGQHIYRSIHSIFLDDVDASLVLFDPTNRQDPLKGAQFWLEQLKGKKQLPPSILVGARLDRGAPVLSQQEIDQFCQKYGVSGGYIGTSAKSGEGLDILLEMLKKQIPWDQMTTTVTTLTFKRIKDYVLRLKEKPDRESVLVRPDELRKQLQATDTDWSFTDDEMMTAVGHLENHGYVVILKGSTGEEYILLVPDLLVDLASSIVLLADRHAKELGAINETELLTGKYRFDELKGLAEVEQQILLDAAVLRFLEHSLCFRETLGRDTLLIFPSLIKQKRPLKDDFESTDDISYIVRGRVENIYPSLVVLLGYTSSFNRVNQWSNQVQYETADGNTCGFRLVEDREGEIELILYYGNDMPQDERNDFQTLFEQFLSQREVDIRPFPPVICPNRHLQERATVVKRSQEGKKFIFCDECGEKALLPDPDAQQPLEIEIPDWLKRDQATARLKSTYETYLVRVKGYRRGRAHPRCYISFVGEQKEFAERLSGDLANAGIFVVDLASKVETNDSIIVIDSPSYQKAWQGNSIHDDIRLIRSRLLDSTNKGITYINQVGNVVEHALGQCESKSFGDPTHYVINLFDLILKLHLIPLNGAGFIELRQALHQQWEQTLAPRIVFEKNENLIPSNIDQRRELYVSYAWGGESEKLVNEIDQAFLKKGINITRDKRDLGYKGSIKEFMERIGRGRCVVVVLSDKYLKSKNCMFELLQIAQNQQFKDRIFPVVLSDANIYESIKRIEYIKHWESKKKELNKAIKGVSAEHLQGIREEIDLFDDIRDEIAALTNILQDMNTLTPDMHRDTNFQTLFEAVMTKLEE